MPIRAILSSALSSSVMLFAAPVRGVVGYEAGPSQKEPAKYPAEVPGAQSRQFARHGDEACNASWRINVPFMRINLTLSAVPSSDRAVLMQTYVGRLTLHATGKSITGETDSRHRMRNRCQTSTAAGWIFPNWRAPIPC